MAGRTFVDTNVFVYLFDADAPAKQARARQTVTRAAESLVLSTQVLSEFYVTVTRKLAVPLRPVEAEAAVKDLAAFEVVAPGAPTVLRAIALSQSRQLAFWDALIIETALAAGCDRLLTEDLQPGQRFDAVVVENPFE